MHYLYSSPNIIWVKTRQICGACGMYGGEMDIEDFSEQTSRKETIGKIYA